MLRFAIAWHRYRAIGALENALPGSLKTAETPLVGDPRIVERPVNLSFDGATEGAFPHGGFDSCGFVSGVSLGYNVRVTRREGGAGHACRSKSRVRKPANLDLSCNDFLRSFWLDGRSSLREIYALSALVVRLVYGCAEMGQKRPTFSSTT